MKKLLTAIIVFVCCTFVSEAQWTRLDLPSGNYCDIFFSAEKTGFLVGDSGMVLKTVDDGVTWRKIDVGIKSNLKSVHFPSANVGYIVGDSAFLKTVDGGERWEVQKDSNFRWANRVKFISESLGFVEVMYSSSYKTTDGGKTWKYGPGVNNLNFTRDGLTYGISEEYILKSSDSAENWDSFYYVGLPLYSNVCRFADENNVVAGCGGFMSGFTHSADGGKTWKSLVFPGSYSQMLLDSSGRIGKGVYDIFFASSTVGYGIIDTKGGLGPDFGFIKTKNSGTDWTFIRLNPALYFYSDRNSKVYFKNENVGYIIDGKVFKTTTGGEEPVSVQEPLLKNISPNISPNPFKNSARIELPENLLKTQIKIFTAAGEDCSHCFKSEFFENYIAIERIAASAGMYYYTIESEGKTVAEGKFVVE
ncbi:MAG: YCF48-related protein [Bacteroidota bacterium]